MVINSEAWHKQSYGSKVNYIYHGMGGRGRENLVSDSSCYWECSCDGRLGCLTLIHIVHEKVGRLAFDGSSLNKFKQRRVEVSTGV